ncbi:AraC family ligand binding domain-containing protein, partial [Streptomyces albidoflavus]
MTAGQQIHAWRPPVPGVAEVFHAHFTEHAYPMHVHDVWTLLLVDDGAVRYDLDRHPHGTPADTVTLLPPHVPHNGSPATAHGFRKRVLYLDLTQLGPELVGPAVDRPELADALLRRRVGRLHTALAAPGDELEAESRLALIRERLRAHLRPRL